jgi:hypothetical protein
VGRYCQRLARKVLNPPTWKRASFQSAMHHAVDEPTIALECEDHIDVSCEPLVKGNIVHTVGDGCGDGDCKVGEPDFRLRENL